MYSFVVTVFYYIHVLGQTSDMLTRNYFLDGPDSETVMATARRMFLSDITNPYYEEGRTVIIVRLEYNRLGIILHA